MTDKKPDESIKDSKETKVCEGHEEPKVQPDTKQAEVKTEEVKPSFDVKDLQDQIKTLQTDYSSISGTLEKLKTTEVQAGVRTIEPTATVQSGTGEPFNLTKTIEHIKKWVESDRDMDCTVKIPMDYLRNITTQKVKTSSGIMETWRNPYAQDQYIQEALTYSGTMPGISIDSDVALIPGGISSVPVTQFAKYKQIPQGENIARFFKGDMPERGTQTPGTTATEGTQVITSVDVTPSTITGTYLKVDTDAIENNPFDAIAFILKTSARESNDFIANNMLNTVSAEGTLTPGLWIKGSDGTTITSSDTASVALDPTGIATGVEYLGDRGYLDGGVAPVCFLDYQQFKELIEDTELTNWIAFSNPDVYGKNVMAELYGCRLVSTNKIQERTAQTNKGLNAIMCVPNHSYGVGVKRNVTVKFHEFPEDNQIRVNTNYRMVSAVIDATSIVRISTTGA